MKTDDLVMMLATNAGPVAPAETARRYATALGWGAIGAVVLMAVLLGVRTDLAEASRMPIFWIKFLFPALLAAGAFFATARLSRPGMRLGQVPAAIAAPVLVLWAIAVYALAGADAADRSALVFGETWKSCPFNIATLSIPAFAAILWAMKGLAPTRLALSGASAGLLSGSLGALIYALHCPEMEAPFLAVWYLLGILIPTVVGAIIGPRLLRW